MLKGVLRFSWIALLFAYSAFAVQSGDTVTMKLTTVGSGAVMGGVYTSPYGVSVNGASTTLLICDDFLTDVALGQTWTATVTTLEDLQSQVGTVTTPQTPKFTSGTPTGTVTAADVAKYATAGVLASQLMALSSLPVDANARGELSFAIWGIFDPVLLDANPASGLGHLSAANLAGANSYLAAAEALVAAATSGGVVDLSKLPFASLTIYTPNPLKASQEMLQVTRIAMAEPPYPLILGLDLLAVFGLIVFCRRRLGLLN